MKIPFFPVSRIPAMSCETVIDAATLTAAINLNAQLRRAGAERLRRARRHIATRRRQAEAALREHRVAFEVEMAERAATIEQDAVASALIWRVAVEEFEAAVTDRVASQVAECAARAFLEFAASEDRAVLLATKVQASIKTLPETHRPVLSVHGDHVAALTQKLGERTCRIVADDTLSPACAMLDTPFLRIVIDLDRHAELLAAHLRSPMPETLALQEAPEMQESCEAEETSEMQRIRESAE